MRICFCVNIVYVQWQQHIKLLTTMGSASSLFQGVFFAIMNTAILAYSTQETVGKHIDEVHVIPRMLVFHFCLTFLLGIVMLESLTTRLITNNALRPTFSVGPTGIFLATLGVLYVTEVAVMITEETALLIFPIFMVIYAYSTAIGRQTYEEKSMFAPPFAALLMFIGTFFLYTKAHFADPVADHFASYYELSKSERKRSYLTEKGSLFDIPMAVPLLASGSMFAFAFAHTR